MINTEAKSLQRDINKLNVRIAKLPKNHTSACSKIRANAARALSAALNSCDRNYFAEKRQLEAQMASLTNRLNIIIGRAGK